MLFECAERSFALYSSLISHFGHFRKKRKIDAKMTPKINEHLSKTRSRADLGPLILGFLAFWSDAKKTLIFHTSPNAPKIRKIAPRSGLGRLCCELRTTSWGSGPQGGHARDKILGTRYKVQRYKGTNASWPVGKRESWLVRTGKRLV